MKSNLSFDKKRSSSYLNNRHRNISSILFNDQIKSTMGKFELILLFSIILIIEKINCQKANRTYLIKKDLISGLKGGEFSIYDDQGKNQVYRMESKVGATHNVKLFKGQDRKTPLAILKGKFSVVLYKASISILNEKRNQWNNGTIQQNYKIVGNKFLISFDNVQISMEGKAASLDTNFIDQSNGNILAKFRKRISSLFWKNKYDLQILSDSIPDYVYFLGVAARDHTNKKIHSG